MKVIRAVFYLARQKRLRHITLKMAIFDHTLSQNRNAQYNVSCVVQAVLHCR